MLLGSQLPTYRTVPSGAVSSWGPEAIDLIGTVGIELDDGQQDILNDGMAENAAGQWLASEVADDEPRQNGKSLLLEARALAGLYLVEEPLIVWTAHEFKTAHRSFLSLKQRITDHDHLRKRVKAIRSSTHAEEIELFNPYRVCTFLARSGGSGRGFAQVAPLFLDEAYALTPEQMAALVFAMSAAPNPQVWYMSSAPLATSQVFRDICIRGRKGSSTLIYYEWSATGERAEIERMVRQNKALSEEQALTPDGQLLREALFAKVAEANRAFRTRISDTSILRELASTGVEQFCRERLGLFSAAEAGGRIDRERWDELADGGSRRDGDVALAIDISPERDWAAIGVYGLREDDLGHVQLAYYGPPGDLLDKLDDFRAVLDPRGIGMARGTYASLKEELKDRGYLRPQDRPSTKDEEGRPHHPPEHGDLMVFGGTDMAAACGQVIDAVKQGTLRYVPSEPLTSAVAIARTRKVGEDAIVWSRGNDKDVDISGLVVITEARHVFYARADVARVDDYDPVADIL